MAKKWFTPYPDVYFMRALRKGGRNEFIFTFLGYFVKKRCDIFRKICFF
jgi:hypothetical protein